ncbi:hypothetical protein GCM10023082_01050 [Streptomyces tremellae]|uniref:Uncharacterized protein n=1 Tax=Streptomyces tremellae TaxID=1124239 RepID=A0ABP7DLG6_9ACTN
MARVAPPGSGPLSSASRPGGVLTSRKSVLRVAGRAGTRPRRAGRLARAGLRGRRATARSVSQSIHAVEAEVRFLHRFDVSRAPVPGSGPLLPGRFAEIGAGTRAVPRVPGREYRS